MSQPNMMDERARSIDLTTSDRHRLLADDRRRLVLDILAGTTTPVDLEELAAGVAAREEGVDTPDEEGADRVATTLHHHHLPKMADMHVLEYDSETNVIAPSGVALEDVRPDYFDSA
ncbi:DUF7344 domain-containing protein [Natronosalvus caseinilyticus]|uniref:DUF7344 domain-containing protein n=1 Tax=Natronosalvus caseinilyticus TaxID=2953747 RepID=UPI0028A77FD6|nr:hypothetical protein [Natronosalvus caseinilyticus]